MKELFVLVVLSTHGSAPVSVEARHSFLYEQWCEDAGERHVRDTMAIEMALGKKDRNASISFTCLRSKGLLLIDQLPQAAN